MPQLRTTLRSLARQPGFTAVVLLTLGVSVGANSAIFSIVNGLLLRPYPYSEPERLVMVWATSTESGLAKGGLSFPDFAYLEEEATSFEAAAAFYGAPAVVAAGDAPLRAEAGWTTSGLFRTLGVTPLAGRLLQPADDRPGAEPVVVLGETLWRTAFGADPGVVGKRIEVARESRQVVGVAPGEADLPGGAELWLPLALDAEREAANRTYLQAIARLRPGVTPAQAGEELARIAPGLRERFPETPEGRGFRAVPLREERIGGVRLIALVLLAMVLLVLLIACANLTNLFLVRYEGRHRELAVRSAMGARRGRLLAELLRESLILGLAGGALGLALGAWGIGALLGAIPVTVPGWMRFDIDYRVVAATFGAAIAAMLAVGLISGRRAMRGDLYGALQKGGAGGGRDRRRLHGALVVVDLAVSLSLLIGAGLMLRSLRQLERVDPGFRTAGVLTFATDLLPEQCPECDQRVMLFDTLHGVYEALPGVDAVGAVSYLPLTGSGQTADVTLEGQTLEGYRANPTVLRLTVSPGYFDALGIPLVVGTPLPPESTSLIAASDPRILVNQELARRMWPGEHPVGKRLKLGPPEDAESPWLEVRGVVGDNRHFGLGRPVIPTLYEPFARAQHSNMTFVVRTGGEPLAMLPSLRRTTGEVLGGLALYDPLPLDRAVVRSIWQPRLISRLIGVFAAIAVVLAVAGFYGLMSYSVIRRTREIGVRMAVGAGTRSVVAMVMRRALALTAAGIALGLPLAVGLAQGLRSLLFEVGPFDPWTYCALAVLMVAVALAAAYPPARRATRVDPVRALRHE
jgi:predicted permease